jgi:4-amino-4-deoxy-L-arabinose transferase-like glycosyltransferase
MPDRSTPLPGPRRRLRRAHPVLWIVAAAVALVATDLGARTLATNDEARFPLLAQDMLARNDWLHPMVNGSPYYNKPPLQAWLIAAASWPGGSVTPLSAVLPSALAAIGATLLVWGLGRTLFGTDAARAAALTFMTMQGVFLHARLPLPDMLTTALIGASLWMYAVAIRRGGATWWAFYALVGLAFWAKGPAGFLPLLIAVVDGVLRWGRAWWWTMRLVPGLVVVGAVIAPWFVVGLTSNAGAVRDVVVADQLLWFTPAVPSFASVVAPFQNLASVTFPWVLVLPLVAAQALRATRGRGTERDHVVFLLTWTIVTFLVVGMSRQQRLRYYVPLAPPLALLIGWWYAGSVVKHRAERRLPWWVYAALAAGLAVLTLVVSASRARWRSELRLLLPDSTGEALLLCIAMALVIGGLVAGVRLKRLAAGFAAAWIGAGLLLVSGYHWALERRNAAYDYPGISTTTRPVLDEGSVVRAWGVPALPLAFYFRRTVTDVVASRPLPPLPARPASTVTIARATLLEGRGPGDVVVVGRARLGADAVIIVRQESTRP